MKLVAGLIITLVAVMGHAQAPVCTDVQIKKEARDFLVAADVYGAQLEYIQDCLKAAIAKEAELNKRDKTARTTRSRVLNVLAEIKHADMAALIKCETSGTPGCIEDEDEAAAIGAAPRNNRKFSKEEEEILASDADKKNEGVKQDRENGNRDW